MNRQIWFLATRSRDSGTAWFRACIRFSRAHQEGYDANAEENLCKSPAKASGDHRLMPAGFSMAKRSSCVSRTEHRNQMPQVSDVVAPVAVWELMEAGRE